MAGIMQARVELANEALARLAQLLYERDTDGAWANIDPYTHRLLIPAPWGRSGYKQWGLRWHEADTLRRVLLRRQRGWAGGRPLLYLWDEETRCWRLNLDDYPTLDAATFWLKRSGVVLVEWREVAQELAGRVRGR